MGETSEALYRAKFEGGKLASFDKERERLKAKRKFEEDPAAQAAVEFNMALETHKDEADARDKNQRWKGAKRKGGAGSGQG